MRIKLLFITSVLVLGACSNEPAPAAANDVPSEPASAASSTESSKLDLTNFVAEVDKNHDGCMSHDEWFGLGLPESANTMLKDPKGCVTLESMTNTAPPPGIDADHDGKLSVAEFLAYDKKGPPGGQPPETSVPPPPRV